MNFCTTWRGGSQMRQQIRSSDVFLRMDLAQMMQAILDANERLATAFPYDSGVQSYRAGFISAVMAMAVAIGAQDHVRPAQQQQHYVTARVGAWEVAR